jgi:hypothetical protein
MRVTLDHRQAASGGDKHHFIDCSIEFSQEERAIIKQRGLHEHGFTVPSANPIPTNARIRNMFFVRILGVVLVVAAITMRFGGFSANVSGLAGVVAGLGIAAWVYGVWVDRRMGKAIDNPEQRVEISKLLNGSGFTVAAVSAAHAKTLESEIREHLATLKTFIAENAALPGKQTFDL